MTKVSVLMPNYNNGPFLKEALDSIFSQSHSDFIIYFIDDCSTDDSVSIAKTYDSSRIKIIQKHENSGIVDTMNIGLNLIETDYFIRMDGDDLSTPDRFQKLVAFMDAHPEIGVCSSDIRMFGKEDYVLKFERDPLMNKANLIFGHAIGHASSIFRTSVFKKNAISYRDLFWRMEDYDLFYQLKHVTLTTSIPGEFYLYRRDTYNDNPELSERKNHEFKKFYTCILVELGLTPNEKNVRIHLELNNREKPSYRLNDYKNHIDLLRKANAERAVFPKQQLNVVLKKYFSKFVYRLIAQNQVRFLEILSLLFTHPQGVTYYFRLKIHTLIRRNKSVSESNSAKKN